VGAAVVQHYHESVAEVPVACRVDLGPTATEHKKTQIDNISMYGNKNTTTMLHNGLFSRTAWASQPQKSKPF